MRSFTIVVLLALAAWAQQPAITGYWEGALQTPAGRLRLGVHVSRNEDGSLAGKLDSIDQGAFGLALQDVLLEGTRFSFAFKMVGASFEGKLNEGATEIAGTFTQGAGMPLVLKKTEKSASAPKRTQIVEKPFPYKDEDVTFENSAAGAVLAGTLTIPAGKGPFPAAILITGSGPQDRDETLMGHKPFLVLADHLTRKGIAVLRYDDRGFGKSTGKFATATTEDFASDASAAIDYLKARPEVQRERIGLIGHSEGGLVAPMVAAKRSDVAFVVMMAGTAVTGDLVIYEQGQAILKANGATDEAMAQQRATQKTIFDIVRQGKDVTETEAQLKQALGDSPAMAAQIRNVNTPWFRYFLSYNPVPALAKVKAPILALNGELDLQVLPAQNVPVIEETLKKSGNQDYTVTRLPGLNHLFQTAKTGAPAEYGQLEETVSPVALNLISAWVRKHTGLD